MSRLLAFIMGLLGAVGTSQAPGFTQQYMQNLSGRVDELRAVVTRFDEDAVRSEMTRQEALEFCLEDDQAPGTLSCLGRAGDVERYEELSSQLRQLEITDDWQKPIYLARNFDEDVLESTKGTFQPAVPATAVGGGYGAAGFALFWGLMAALLGIITAPFRRY